MDVDMHVRIALFAFTALFALFGRPLTASSQDMAVYTTVSMPVEGEPAKPVGRSLTLFHAGKVYDYMEDAGELVVLEPHENRFTIVSGNHYTGARVEFSELIQFLKVAHAEMQSIVDTPQGESASLSEWLQFQLDPQFRESSGAGDRLSLNSTVMNYSVQTAKAPEPEQVERYLSYADWAAKLNFVLHPGSTYPAPRLKLNEALRRGGVLPVMVELVSSTDPPVHLRASHKFQWDLQSAEKQHIHQWERLLESKQVRWVGFHEYQERLIAEVARRAK